MTKQTRRPKAGDTVRVERSYWGDSVYFTDHILEEFNFCLGFYGEDGPKAPCNFTPLSELYDRHPEAESEYWSNYGSYFTKHVNKFEIIQKQ